PGATRTFNGVTRTIGWFTLSGGVFSTNVSALSPTGGNGTVTGTDRSSLMHSLNRLFADNTNDGVVGTAGAPVAGSASGSMITVSNAATNDIVGGDVLTYTLNEGATTADGREVLAIRIDQADGSTSAFDSGALNAPATGLFIYPGVAANAGPDVYEPGDKVNVRVSSSVVDPAGNSVDSGNDEDDDTAS
ncbi:MAG: hypothetical protein ACAI44_16375, partial [Candidatus Sericytochromatia bacterium]